MRIPNIIKILCLTAVLAATYSFAGSDGEPGKIKTLSGDEITTAENKLTDSVIHISKVYKTIDSTELKADIFYKESSLHKVNNSAIACFHGGGWVCGSRSDFYETCKRYASKGMIAFTFQYRFADHKTLTPIDCVSDAKSAIRWIRKNANAYNININKIVAMGQSAGGHLAMCTTMIDMYDEKTEDLNISPKANAIVLWGSGGGVAKCEWMESLLLNHKSEILNIDPDNYIKPGLPPFLLNMGTSDKITSYEEVKEFVYKMKNIGNDIELVTYPGKGHFLDETCKKHARMFNDEMLEVVDKFLIKHKFLN